MSLPADACYALASVAGVCVTALAVAVARTRDTLGVRALVVYLLVVGVGSLLVGAGMLADAVPVPAAFSADRTPLLVPTYGLLVASTAPLLVFALQFTGRIDRPTRSVSLAVAVLLGLFLTDVSLTVTRGSPTDSLRVVTTLGWGVTSIAYGAVSVYVLLSAAVGDRPLRLRTAVGLAAPGVVAFLSWRLIGVFHTLGGDVWAAGAFAAVPVVAAAGVTTAVVGDDAFDTLPAVQRIGRRAVLRETDDLVVVADRHGTVVDLNDTAAATLGVEPRAARGRCVADLLDHEVNELADAETVRIRPNGRDYDPQVSRLTDHRDRSLGTVVSCRDVTRRERREQRLAVLNRVLRHDLRNRVDVIRAHAEAMDGDHAATIREAAETIAGLGEDARTIDRFVSESSARSRVDLSAVVGDAVAAVDAPAGVTVVSRAGTARLTTDAAAVRAALDAALTAVVAAADASVVVDVRPASNGYVIAVEGDDALPTDDRETLALDRETPLKHGTGLGLWKLRWAVRTLDGAASVVDDGTTVEITVPDRANEQ